MKHRFGVYLNADKQLLLAALLKQLRGTVRLTAADFEYPHKLVSIRQLVTYSPEYRVSLRLVMHDGYKSLTGGDPGRHRQAQIMGNGQNLTRTPIPPTAIGYTFGASGELDYRMILGALVRKLGGNVVIKETDFPEQMGVGTTLFSVTVKPYPLSIDLELERRRGNIGLTKPEEVHGRGLIYA